MRARHLPEYIPLTNMTSKALKRRKLLGHQKLKPPFIKKTIYMLGVVLLTALRSLEEGSYQLRVQDLTWTIY